MQEVVFKKDKRIILCNCISAVLLVLLLVTQFLPFYTCENCKNSEDGTESISSYVWFPDKHRPITNELNKVYKEVYGDDYVRENGKKFKFNANDMALTPVVLFVAAVVGIVMCLIKSHKFWVTLLPLVSGGVGAWGYLTSPALQVGRNWVLHLVAALVVAVWALVPLVLEVMKAVKEHNEKKQRAQAR